MKHTALHLAVFGVLAGAALAAQAADVQIYGRVDAGFLYEHKKGEDTFTQKAGGRAHNRIGFNVVEDLGNGVKVKAYLENGFYIDNGQFDDSKVLFNRRSILALQGSLGEIGFGRMGTVQSTVAPYTMGLIKYDPFGTSYGNASNWINFLQYEPDEQHRNLGLTYAEWVPCGGFVFFRRQV